MPGMEPTDTGPGRKPRRGTAASSLVAIRLTPPEMAALRAAADTAGVSVSGYIRRRLFHHSGEAKLPQEPRRPSTKNDLEKILEAAHAELTLSNMQPLVYVAAVVRRSGLPTQRAQAALLLGSMRGKLELRPESSMGRLTKADSELCPKGFEGVTLSVMRLT